LPWAGAARRFDIVDADIAACAGVGRQPAKQKLHNTFPTRAGAREVGV
jgi:hypothetical protein